VNKKHINVKYTNNWFFLKTIGKVWKVTVKDDTPDLHY